MFAKNDNVQLIKEINKPFFFKWNLLFVTRF